jgi:hypothetical protein
VVFNDSEGNTIWLNDGAGGFASTGQQPVPAEVWWNRLVH